MAKKTAIVVGATSGIGRQLALLLAKDGYLVGVTGRRLNLLEELKSELPDNVITSNFDITNISDTHKNLDELVRKLGLVNLVILSSGTGYINNNLDFDVEKKTLDVNVLGFTLVSDWTISLFQKQKFGHFVAITSIAGMTASGKTTTYNATKAFQINYLKGLRKNTNKLKLPIYITDIRPGFVNTEMAKGEKTFWIASVEKAAQQILSAIKHKRQVAYITRRWRIIGIILRLIK